MIILSHRGYWKTVEEKNTPEAFARSFELGFGTETDVRDCAGELVISHDPPRQNALSCADFFDLYRKFSGKLPLALNIKADGLQSLLSAQLERSGITDYFMFDMSVPDAWVCVQQGLRVFTRQSEFEREPSLYAESAGVWIDCFFSDWVDERTIEMHLNARKQVCLVSPDLHRREHESFWENLSKMAACESSDLMICTDYPEQAREFFAGYLNQRGSTTFVGQVSNESGEAKL